MFGFPLVQKIVSTCAHNIFGQGRFVFECDQYNPVWHPWGHCLVHFVCKKASWYCLRKYLFLFLDRVIWLSVHASLYHIEKWFCYHGCKCDLNWNIIMRSGYIRLVRVRQLLYWNCQCEQIIFEVRSNISLSVLVFSANFCCRCCYG